MNVLRVYASDFAEKNADNHDELKNEKYAPVLWGGVKKKKKRKVKGSLPSYFHLNTQLCLQPSVSGVLLQHTYTHLTKVQIIKSTGKCTCGRVHTHTHTYLKGYYCTVTHMVQNNLPS